MTRGLSEVSAHPSGFSKQVSAYLLMHAPRPCRCGIPQDDNPIRNAEYLAK